MQTLVSLRRARELEGVADDAIDAFPGVQLFLDGDFVARAGLEASADADVEPFGVLAKDDEVHVLRRASFERAQPLVEQRDRAVVDVEVELEAGPEQNVARVPVVGHARIAERADEDRVEVVAEHRVAVGWNRDAGVEKIVGTPRQRLEIERPPEDLAHAPQHADRFGRHFLPNPVAGDDREFHVSRMSTLRTPSTPSTPSILSILSTPSILEHRRAP